MTRLLLATVVTALTVAAVLAWDTVGVFASAATFAAVYGLGRSYGWVIDHWPGDARE